MQEIPVTYLIASTFSSDDVRRGVMEGFAAAGAEHLVLSDSFISRVLHDEKFAAVLEAELADCGLSLVDAHSPFGGELDLNCPDPAFRPQMLLMHKQAIRTAARFGVDTITIHPGSDRFFPEVPLEKHLDLMRDSLEQLIPEAEKNGVVICIENSMSRAACPRVVTQLKSEFDSPFLGLCFDVGHAHQLDAGRFFPEGTIWKYWQIVGVPEPEWDDNALERMLPEVVNCHLHDNDGSTDSHNMPGKGTVDWEKTMRLLRSAPKLKLIQCETVLRPGDTTAELCRAFSEFCLSRW